MNICDLPPHRRDRAAAITQKVLTAPHAYLEHGGRRLLACDREIVAVPLGGNEYRLLFRDLDDGLAFCGVYTHQDYDKLIGMNQRGKRVQPIEPMFHPAPRLTSEASESALLDTLPEQQPVQEPETPTVYGTPVPAAPVRRKPRTGVTPAKYLLKDWLRTAPHEFSAAQPVKELGDQTTESAVHQALVRLVRSGVLTQPRKGRYRIASTAPVPFSPEPTPAPKPDATFAEPDSATWLVDRIMDHLANLQALTVHKPCTLDSFSDDDLTMEVVRRMSARRGAA